LERLHLTGLHQLYLAKAKTVADNSLTLEQQRLAPKLLDDLEQIALLAGEYILSEPAMSFYVDWYNELSKKPPPIASQHFAGYCERRPAHLRKLSIIFSASRGDDRVVKETDIQRALALLEKAEVKMPRTFTGLGEARYSRITEKVLDLLVTRGEMDKADKLFILHPDADDYTLEIALKTLMAMKAVERGSVGVRETYKYTGRGRPGGEE